MNVNDDYDMENTNDLKSKKKKRKFVIEDVLTKDLEKVEPCLVEFSNGLVKKSEEVRGTLYRNASQKFVRRRKERILKIATERMEYVGANYGEDVVNIYKERFFLGVADRGSSKMRLIEMSSYLLHPKIDYKQLNGNKTLLGSKKTAEEERLNLNAEFGGRRGRSRIKRFQENQFDINDMSGALVDAMDTVEVDEETFVLEDKDIFQYILPPCNREASDIRQVYCLEDIVTDEELYEFNDLAVECLEKELDIKSASLLLKATVVNIKLSNGSEEEMTKMCCVALYTEQLVQLIQLKYNQKPELKSCPQYVRSKIFANFTEGKNRKMTKILQDKVITHAIILGLMANKYELEWITLSGTFGIRKDRLENIIRVVGASMAKNGAYVVLKLPLAKFQPRKSKKLRN